MNVDTEPGIISEVPTWIVRVFINYDRVGVPDPIVYVGKIAWGYAPVPVVKPKSVRAAPCQAPLVPGTEAAGEMAVLPRAVHVKTRIMAFMPYPTVRARVYVRRIRMSGLVAKIATFRGGRFTTLVRDRFTTLVRGRLPMLIRLCFGAARSGCFTWASRRTMCRDIAMTDVASAGRTTLLGVSAGMFFAMLAKQQLGLEKKRNCESQRQHRKQSSGSVHSFGSYSLVKFTVGGGNNR